MNSEKGGTNPQKPMNLRNLVYLISLLILITPLIESIITLGGIIILAPLLRTIIIAKIINSWFAIILFLIYIRGLLVLFGYIMAISPNPKSFNKKLISFIILGFSLSYLHNKKINKLSILYKKLCNINHHGLVLI